MPVDCAIVGGGPAGLNAALVLGRARRSVILFDDNKPRNAVTKESHGFITRDGIQPNEFRRIAHQDIEIYPSIEIKADTIVEIKQENSVFTLVTEKGHSFEAKKIILATGLKEVLPELDRVKEYYGKSLFNCPFCDGWELRDKALVVISGHPAVFHVVKNLYNWSKNLVVCTNGTSIITEEQKEQLLQKGIPVYEQKISSLVGQNGMLEKIILEDQTEIEREGGLISPDWVPASFGKDLGCKTNDYGGIEVDDFGRTSVPGVYVAGDATSILIKQLIVAAGEGNKAAIGVCSDLIQDEF
ncbi:NAD(P)/FAD-dependent oxidoreductase [Paenibacillus eucommiae]|uniref:Thioredoxin reductase n=1 Tax=Paenibacillus eucommiae TaxID=1355755 RepID=A0ABS4ISQ5_9BACL|nr:NAD(P)/FAD-dependent oxidoreductase [Paenibacillus eucommiae]MBP1989906.1 thioredoxin reductase [Paenibacillus eucommiae]